MDRLGDLLALMGDSVDNVPGVTGVGPKTAAKLLLEHGDLEAVLAAAPAMKPGKLRDNLIEQAENARLSKVLVTLKCDAPLPQPLDELALQGIPDAPLRAFLEHHGFKSLLTKLGTAKSAADAPVPEPTSVPHEEDPPCNHDEYETVTDLDALDRWITIARHQGWVAIDTETTAKDPMLAELVGVSMCLQPNLACYIPLGHGGTDMFAEKPEQVDRAAALAKLKDLFEDDAVLKIGHNLKYDLIVLRNAGPRRRAVRRHDRDELRPRRRAARPRHGRTRRDPPLAQLHRLQGRGRDGQEAARLPGSRSQDRDPLRRRGCRRDAAAVAAVQAAPARRTGARGSTRWSTARWCR